MEKFQKLLVAIGLFCLGIIQRRRYLPRVIGRAMSLYRAQASKGGVELLQVFRNSFPPVINDSAESAKFTPGRVARGEFTRITFMSSNNYVPAVIWRARVSESRARAALRQPAYAPSSRNLLTQITFRDAKMSLRAWSLKQVLSRGAICRLSARYRDSSGHASVATSG